MKSIHSILSLTAVILAVFTISCAQEQASTATEEPKPEPAKAEAAATGTATASGTFDGRSDHVMAGGVSIVKDDAGKFTVVMAEDFSLDNAPDPKVALGKDGVDKATMMGKLQNLTGAQSYAVPDGVDPANYNEVWVWCEKFDVPLGVAKLK